MGTNSRKGNICWGKNNITLKINTMTIAFRTRIRTLFTALITITANAKPVTITIKSTIICDECTERVRNALVYEKGIKKITTDLKTQEIYVKYNPKKIDEATIKKLIAAVGYNADDVKRNETVYEALPAGILPSAPLPS